MLNSTYFRPLLIALYCLIATVSVMILLVISMAWYAPALTQPKLAKLGELAEKAPKMAAKTMSADAIAGKEIFAANCSACHSTGTDKLTGPGLAGARQRTPGDVWLQKWIHNSSVVVASGDAYAVKIFTDNNKIQMPSFLALTDVQIKQVLDYIDSVN